MSSVISVFQNDWVMLTVPLLAGIRLSEEQWRRALRVFMVSLGLVAIYGIVQFFAGMEYFRGKHLAAYGNHFRATGGFNFYLTYAGNQMMGFAVLLSAFLGSLKNKKPELPYLISGILVLLSIVATFSRSTWLALVVVIAVITLMLDRRWFGWGLISLIAAGTVAAFVSPEIMERITSIWDPAKNAPRLNLWHTGWNMVKANPWLGIGPGEFNRVFEIYKHPGYYDAGGHAHNDMLNLAANSGIPAMLAWLGMWGFLIFSAFKGYRNPQNSAYQRTIIRGMVAAVAGILLAGFFQCYYTDLENNIFWWAMVVWGVNMLPKESGQ